MRTLAVAVALALLAAGCGGSGDAGAPGTGGGGTVPTADDPLAGVTLDGERLSLADFRGETVFVNVWSSW